MKKRISILVTFILLILLFASGCAANHDSPIQDNSSQMASVTTVSSLNKIGADTLQDEKYEAVKEKISKIPAEDRNEFCMRFHSYSDYLNMENKRMTDALIYLCTDGTDQIQMNFGRPEQTVTADDQTGRSDFLRNYIYGYTIEDSNSKCNIDIKTYGFKQKNQDYKEIVYFIGSDHYIETVRGWTGDINSLIIKYPDHLYRVDAKSLEQFGSKEAKITNYDCAYSYITDLDSGCDLTFYFKNNSLVYTELYYSLDGCRWSKAELVRDVMVKQFCNTTI